MQNTIADAKPSLIAVFLVARNLAVTHGTLSGRLYLSNNGVLDTEVSLTCSLPSGSLLRSVIPMPIFPSGIGYRWGGLV